LRLSTKGFVSTIPEMLSKLNPIHFLVGARL
jgi:hypothetical protein